MNNKIALQALPKAKPYELRDAKLNGLLLRVQPSGIKTWYLEFERGKRIRLGRLSSMGHSEAVEAAKNALGPYWAGTDPRIERQKRKQVSTFGDFIDEYYADWAAAHQKTATATIKRLKVSFSKFLNMPMATISTLDMERWRAQRMKDGVKTNTVNRDITAIKAALNRAVEWELIAVNPIAKVKKAREDKEVRVRYLDEAEEHRLRSQLKRREQDARDARDRTNQWRRDRKMEPLPSLYAVPFTDHLMPMVLLSINTGMRRGELFDLKWSHVNFDRRIVTVSAQTAKSRKTRHIPLNAEAFETLRAWRSQCDLGNSRVFESEDGARFDNVNSSWKKLLEDAKIADFRWHDMRHHFASRLAMGAVDLNTIRELLGHSDYGMTLRYAHLAPEHRREAVEVLDKPRPHLKIVATK